MNTKLLLYVSLFALSFLWACEKNDDESTDTIQEQKNIYVNNWIYQNMSFVYLWNDKMPAPKSLNYKENPETFFDKVLYPYNSATHDGDRFSWIQNNYADLLNYLNGVSSSDIGFEAFLSTSITPKSNILEPSYLVPVMYVKKGSDAEAQGLKRGDMLVKIDGNYITRSNFYSLIYANKPSYTIEYLNGVTQEQKEITIKSMKDFQENPVYQAKVLDPVGDNVIGYLAYNFFAADNGDDSYSYDLQLMTVLNDFLTKGVNNLVLDLRYNGGGSIQSAVFLASALIKTQNRTDIFAKNEFNPQFSDYAVKTWGEEETLYYKFTNKVYRYNADGTKTELRDIPKLGDQLKKVYILTGENTASASELLINGLQPYLGSNIVLIGDVTYGKNVGSLSIYEPDDAKNKWGMQPIVLKTSNRDGYGDYGAGIDPQNNGGVLINEFHYMPLAQLGDEDELLFGIAISQITGQNLVPTKKSASEISSVGSSLALKKGAYQMFIDDARFKNFSVESLIKE